MTPRLARPLRVLLCPDQPDWAFDNIANNIVRFAPPDFEVSKFFLGTAPTRDIRRFYEHIATADVDLVHFFWREDLFALLRPESILPAAERLGVAFGEVVDMIGARALTTSVYDHLFGDDAALDERLDGFAAIDGYTVSSAKLERVYRTHASLPPPDAVITDGVDVDAFSPRETGPGSGPPVIGWVGNSAWGKSQGGDPKGYHRLFQPALDLLRQRGVGFEVAVADPQVNRIPFDRMPDFYRGLDVFVCTSAAEGTPNPVLEAMATGITVVSTDVGIVAEALGSDQQANILPAADPAVLADRLAAVLQDRALRERLGAQNRARAATWSWEKRTRPWWPFFLAAYVRAADRRWQRRRASMLHGACLAYQHHAVRPQQGVSIWSALVRARGRR